MSEGADIEKAMAAQSLFRKGQKILVAVSGGVDSMVLLAVLHRLAPARRWKLTVAHFNHQLRGAGSDADERLVRDTARQLNLPFVSARGAVRTLAKKTGVSMEMAARTLRHDFLARTAKRLGIPTIALAHHADDQVELFFLRLLRGAGVEGLAGMKCSSPSPSAPGIRLARPLLGQPKEALRNFARQYEIFFSEDATNGSFDIQRNRVRHELIPLLKQRYQPALEGTILRLMDVIGAESEFVAQTLPALSSANFESLPVAAQRRLLHQQLLKLKLAPDFDLIERLRRAVEQPFSVNPHQAVGRDKVGILHLSSTERVEFRSQNKALSLSALSGTVFDGMEIRWRITQGASKPRANTEYFDADKIGDQISLRCWQPGDRFQPIGAESARKLQNLFTNLRVPRQQRHQRVLALTGAGEVFWVEGLRMAEKFKLDRTTARKLQWQWRRQPLESA